MNASNIDNDSIANTIKLLLYKQNPTITAQLDFENNDAFLEPLVFAFFNNPIFPDNREALLKELMQGYYTIPIPLQIKYLFNENDIAYIPNKGYYTSDKKHIESPSYLDDKKTIELLKVHTPLLYNFFRDKKENPLDSKLIEIDDTLFLKNIKALKNAVGFINKCCPLHFKLIQKSCNKLCIFKTDPQNTNSFASNNVLGIAFLNAYQDDYDEVFFIDDIAHQTGHAIMFNFWFKKQDHFIIDPNTPLAPILQNPKEYRSFYVLFHALYTYYTSILCLDNCLENKFFNNKQKREALARIGFYLNKYQYDLICFEKVCLSFTSIENVIKEPSINLYGTIKEKYIKMASKYGEKMKNYKYNNQPYNFTFSNFMEINP